MNGVLSRMVQRAQGRLPAVEPLVKSHKTALAALSTLTEEKGERVSPMREHDLQPQQVVRTSEQPGFSVLHEHHVSQALTTEKAKVQGKRDREIDDQSRDHVLDRRPVSASDELSRSREIESSRLKSAESAKQPQDENEGLILDVRTAAHANAESRSEVQVKQRLNDAVRHDDNDQETKTQRTERSHETADQLEVAAEHTEIHITIGSVEFRAPVAEAPQRTPAFKPRMSLSEFLSGRRGVEL